MKKKAILLDIITFPINLLLTVLWFIPLIFMVITGVLGDDAEWIIGPFMIIPQILFPHSLDGMLY